MNSRRIVLFLGIASKNTLRYLSVNAVFNNLGDRLCKALPALHAFTGSDYTSSFARKGKLKPVKILQKNEEFQTTFSTFGESEILTDNQIAVAEHFVCTLYGKPKQRNINKARYEIFLDSYKPKSGKINPLEKVKNLDAASIPPCKDVLLLKIKRINQVCAIWRYACSEQPNFYKPLEHGWSQDGIKYTIQWFTGPRCPPNLDDIIEQDNDECDDLLTYDDSSDED